MKHHIVEQNTTEWMALRAGKVTASEFKDCFSKETTQAFQNLIYKKRAEIRTGEIEESFTNEWMQRGHLLEPEARKEYELTNLVSVEDGGFWEYSEFIGASPDGFVGEDGLLEIKCPKASTMERYMDENKLPSIYKWQIHGQMLCTGRQWVDFVVYHPMYELFQLRIERDSKLIKELEEQLNYVIKKIKEKL